MSKEKNPKHSEQQQGNPTSDRAHHDVKEDKKMQGISNSGGQRSDQTSNKDNARKRENKS
ncbi:hypothetical protein [Pedobacter immunditicola]|uniref:hypothetical protein n=1 Tax=Pedobacter immunditicola TaxID=3133440 RepID=UPI003098DC92